jgi:hypothetical protein
MDINSIPNHIFLIEWPAEVLDIDTLQSNGKTNRY